MIRSHEPELKEEQDKVNQVKLQARAIEIQNNVMSEQAGNDKSSNI